MLANYGLWLVEFNSSKPNSASEILIEALEVYKDFELKQDFESNSLQLLKEVIYALQKMGKEHLV